MKRHWLTIGLGLALGLGACAFACGMSDDGRLASSSSSSSSGGVPSLDAASDAAGEEPARGVVLVHAAAFPSFRLCFGNYPELKPQPDSKIMPNANVVGVEVGSVVRIDPLPRVPGKVFVIDRGEVEATPGDEEPSCGALICDDDAGPRGDDCLRRGQDYAELAPISKPLGADGVELLAVAGCANGLVLSNLGVDPAACGEGWRFEHGNLSAQIVELSSRIASPELGLPVQLVHLAPMLEPWLAVGGRLEITFGPLSKPGALDQAVATDPPLFVGARPETLQIARDESSFYGTHGFRIALTRGRERDAGDSGSDAGAPVVVDQSLAEVQDLSAPRDVPAAYYRAASNYALLLLGDPTIEKTFTDGGLNPNYSPRRGLHLLALPIRDPNDLDGGREGGDGSVESGATGGPW